MSDIVIRVENLGKRYTIGRNQEAERYTALRDVIANGAKEIATRVKHHRLKSQQSNTEEFWALKDVSFEVKRGDRIGIIGRNGAGKSTLLKILSRITEPTEGSISIKGRVASLLEVGTGFHPELTGRENIYLNGAILGMSRAEIRRKFDMIAAFAEVEKFLETPVKRYSSGMYVRLAFAVAAYLEPEILIVDEVLAVGDVAFQKKCLEKIEDVSKEGRTVIFVSHNMSTVISLCNRAFLFEMGKCIRDSAVDRVVAEYMSRGIAAQGEIYDSSPVNSNKKLKIRKIRLLNSCGHVSTEIDSRKNASIEISFEILKPGRNYSISFEVHSIRYGCIFTSTFWDADPEKLRDKYFKAGVYTAITQLPLNVMRGGKYSIKIASAIPTVEVLDIFPQELYFHLVDTNSPVARSGEGRAGCILPILQWKIIKHGET